LAYKIEYKSSVFRELKHLDKRIAREIRESLSLDPSCGEPLTGQFKGMLKLGRDSLIGLNFVIWKSQEFLQAPDMID